MVFRKISFMKKLPEITINPFQLGVLLGKVEKHFYSVVIENYVYCAQCRGFANEGIDVEEIVLTDLNNIRVRGRCRKCNGEVARLFEYGENKDFYGKARRFRESAKK